MFQAHTISTPAPAWIHGTTGSDHLGTMSTAAPVTAATVWGDSDLTTRVTSGQAARARLLASNRSNQVFFLIKSLFRLLHHSVLPEPPVVRLTEVNDNTFSLVWTPGLEGDSPITGFILEYKAINGKTFISASACTTFIWNRSTLNLIILIFIFPSLVRIMV